MMNDNSQKVKEKILKWLKSQHDAERDMIASITSAKQLKLFNINGIELHDEDSLDNVHDDDYLYYSYSKFYFIIYF